MCSYLEHALDRVALAVEDGLLREGIRHHLITADQVLVDNHGAGRMGKRERDRKGGGDNLWSA